MYNLGIDKVILGTAGLGGVWGKVDPEESVQTILEALSHGIGALDAAPAYGDAESIVGQALELWTGERPVISTKVGRLKSYVATEAKYDYSIAGMQRSVDESLRTLGVSTVDVLFLHEPAVLTVNNAERVVSAIEHFKEKGFAKKIGIGGNPPDWFLPFLEEGRFDILMEYNKLNACRVDALQNSIPRCQQTQTEYYAASPLNMGLLGCKFQEFSRCIPDWLDVGTVEQARRIQAIAERNNLPLEVLALRFLLNLNVEFKLVLGAANRQQLQNSLGAINQGKLPVKIYKEILQTFNDNK
ncbi:aldo/keto reductase [Sphingobacterium sp. UGAL515B_05]|uniref:aldo/keto reductase n=1 Tax=Sphingobacterium sp. UGAL515B_05 TaxID=2986767 RepID=UPI002955D07C|nr:aldo/keto reductase [Sphingobacterium sp. UGAL515B_05]WON92713.1 aldo/keto reductase [Sphingobacterium sp. UGAL515B_05]